jgi:pimeloyl-ACP methyl ester carboxylesterase
MGRDYIFSHRAFRQLAIRLSKEGFPVLRFDYYGCGDSAGEGEEGGVERWQEDIALAIGELQARSGVAKVCLAGFRLGASLAALAGIGRRDVEGLLLWDPVLDGAQYAEELAQSHARWAKLQVWRSTGAPGAERPPEVLGFPVTPGLEAGLKKIALTQIAALSARRALLLVSGANNKPALENLANHLDGQGTPVDCQEIPWPEFWSENEELQDVFMPPVRILQAAVSWASEVIPCA